MEEVKYVDREKEIGSHIDFSDFLEEMKKFEEAYPNGINFTLLPKKAPCFSWGMNLANN